jgi:hypothetical protein
MYEEIRIVVEVVSAIVCFILLWFMAKPYILTRENRYLGLPLGFGFLGISYTVVALAISIPDFFASELAWLQLLPRTFAFLFLAVTYYFSKKPSKKSPLIWNVTISFLILVLITLVIMVMIYPRLDSPSYLGLSVYFRIFNLLCLSYLSVYALRSHIRNLEPSTIVIPLCFILLGMNQYSVIIWSVDRSYFAFWGALALRLAALVVILFVSYTAFYRSHKVVRNEKESSQR